jgi:hypothetical protein
VVQVKDLPRNVTKKRLPYTPVPQVLCLMRLLWFPVSEPGHFPRLRLPGRRERQLACPSLDGTETARGQARHARTCVRYRHRHRYRNRYARFKASDCIQQSDVSEPGVDTDCDTNIDTDFLFYERSAYSLRLISRN